MAIYRRNSTGLLLRIFSAMCVLAGCCGISSSVFAQEYCPACPSGCVPLGLVEAYDEEFHAKSSSCPSGCVSLLLIESMSDSPACKMREPKSSLPDKICPSCKAGCIPLDLVDDYDKTGKAQDHRCGKDCVALEFIRSMSDPPRCRSSKPEPKSGKIEKLKVNNQAATRERHIFSRSALGLEKGSLVITGFGAGLWDFQYGIHKNVQLEAVTILPVIFVGLLPSVKVHGAAIKDKLYFSGSLFGGFLASYVDADVLFSAGDGYWLLGGNFAMSRTWNEHIFSLGTTVFMHGYYYSHTFDGDSNYDDESGSVMGEGAFIIPNLSYRYGFHRNWSFQTELTPIMYAGGNSPRGLEDAVYLLSYGFRGHGEMLFGDIGFTLPLHKDFVKYVWKYTPLGFPYFSVGFKF